MTIRIILLAIILAMFGLAGSWDYDEVQQHEYDNRTR